jgi:hypothetical protein
LILIIWAFVGVIIDINFGLVIKTSQLMLCREIIVVCSEIHTKHINRLCGQNVDIYKDVVRTAQ